MTIIRQNAGTLDGIPSGYEGSNIPQYSIPPCGIEDVDKALKQAFEDINFSVAQGENNPLRKVNIVFSAGEKVGMNKLGKRFRDQNGTLILPIIAIHRTSIEQNATGGGINQHTGDITIKKKLNKNDREYQNLINRLRVKNQENLGNSFISGTLKTSRENAGELFADLTTTEGGFLSENFDDNIFEFITIPSPQFMKANYELIIWTNYVAHANEIIEKLQSSYLPTHHGTIKLESEKGYWFISYLKDEGYTTEDNSDDMSSNERILKFKFNIHVPFYIIASSAPGIPIPVRRFISSPFVQFSIGSSDEISDDMFPDKTADISSSDPTLEFMLNNVNLPETKKQQVEYQSTIVKNPFTGKTETRYLRVVAKNKRVGETILRPADIVQNGLVLKIIK